MDVDSGVTLFQQKVDQQNYVTSAAGLRPVFDVKAEL